MNISKSYHKKYIMNKALDTISNLITLYYRKKEWIKLITNSLYIMKCSDVNFKVCHQIV